VVFASPEQNIWIDITHARFLVIIYEQLDAPDLLSRLLVEVGEKVAAADWLFNPFPCLTCDSLMRILSQESHAVGRP
jgi:hypothetical protein